MSGTLAIPEAAHSVPPTPLELVDEAVATLREHAAVWSSTSLDERIALLEELLETTLAASPAWVRRAATLKGIPSRSANIAEDWISGPAPTLRYLRLLHTTLGQIRDTGRPQPPAVRTRPDGQVVVDVFPASLYDRILFPGFTGEVRLQRQVSLAEAEASMGRIYRPGHRPDPGVALVLGAGNVSSIAPTDALTYLFAFDRVVVLKMNPVNEALGPHLAEALAPLVERGFLRFVYGGAEVGQHLTAHPGVDAVHLTGSDKTYEAIVFGPGEEGQRRKADGKPILDKEVTAELGNVSPVIVVPGPWSDADLAFHGDNIASMLTNNAGFNCVAARILVQHRAWARRTDLLHALRDSLRRAEARHPYYPGAVERWQRFTNTYRQAEWYSPEGEDKVPFTLIPELDPDGDDLAFQTEAWCGVLGEVALDAPRSVPDYLDAAVDFCNDRLWGTLGATLLVHPRSLQDPAVADAVERAIDRLEYGAVTVNHWSAVAFGLMSPAWGAYPGSKPTDIQSGTGVMHNSYLLEDVEKSVVRGPFRPPLRPVWFHNHRALRPLGPLIARFYATEDVRLLPAMTFHSLRG